jgi:hypothetical protein
MTSSVRRATTVSSAVGTVVVDAGSGDDRVIDRSPRAGTYLNQDAAQRAADPSTLARTALETTKAPHAQGFRKCAEEESNLHPVSRTRPSTM